MPFPVIPILIGGLTFMTGAFVGSQVDDSIDQAPENVPLSQSVSPTKILLYGGTALALLWGAQKTGLVKIPRR